MDQISNNYFSAYQKIVSRIPTKNAMEEICERLTDFEETWKKIAEALQGPWSSIPPITEDYPFYALRAVKEGKTTIAQFTTLLSYWSLVKDQSPKSIEQLSLFTEEGEPAMEAIEFLLQTFSSTHPEFKGGNVTQEQMDDFLIQMKNAPLSEQQFFSIQEEPQSRVTTIATVVTHIGVNVFLHYKNADVQWRIVPSFTMMQQFLSSRSGQEAVQMLPVLGPSTLQDIRQNGLTDSRDYAVGFPGILLPKEADDVAAPHDRDFQYHDFYHALIASTVPSSGRKAFIHFSDIIQDYSQAEDIKKPLPKLLFKKLRFQCVDMETPCFNPLFNNNPIEPSQYSSLFWDAIAMYIHNLPKQERALSNTQQLIHELSTDNSYYKFFFHLLKNRKEWKEKTGISLKPLAQKAARCREGLRAHPNYSLVRNQMERYICHIQFDNAHQQYKKRKLTPIKS